MLDRVVMEQELARLAERAGVWKEFSSPESGTVWCHEPTGTFSNTIPGDLVLLRGRCDELRGCLAAVVGGAVALGLKRMMVKSPSGARPALPLVVPHGAPPLLLPPAPLPSQFGFANPQHRLANHHPPAPPPAVAAAHRSGTLPRPGPAAAAAPTVLGDQLALAKIQYPQQLDDAMAKWEASNRSVGGGQQAKLTLTFTPNVGSGVELEQVIEAWGIPVCENAESRSQVVR